MENLFVSYRKMMEVGMMKKKEWKQQSLLDLTCLYESKVRGN